MKKYVLKIGRTIIEFVTKEQRQNHIIENKITDYDVYEVIEEIIDNSINEVPQELTRSQLRQALLIKGISETNIVAAINGIENELHRNIMLIKWEDQPTYRRQNDDLKSIGAALNLSEKDINEIFELGATL